MIDLLHPKILMILHDFDAIVFVMIHDFPFSGVIGKMLHILDPKVFVMVHELYLVIRMMLDELDLSVNVAAFAFFQWEGSC